MGTTTIEAMAVASGASQSAVVTATYVVSQAVTAAPTFSPGAGTYSTATKRNVVRQYCRRSDLLHDGWNDADNFLQRVFDADYRDGIADDQSDGCRG